MTHAVIDIGSNTIRTNVYAITGMAFQPLFSEKIIAGLANYIQDEQLNQEGIHRLCASLEHFQKMLHRIGVSSIGVFATASIRNVNNTKEILQAVKKQTGYTIDILSGEDEALLDYYGMLHNIDASQGALFDIGGGSTEIVAFNENEPYLAKSIPIGSLNLFTRYVSDFLPTKQEQKLIEKHIRQELKGIRFSAITPVEKVVGVGGTTRAALKLVNSLFDLPVDNCVIQMDQITTLREIVAKDNAKTRKLILRNCPDRIHTLVPGLLIMMHILNHLKAPCFTISTYGVREGYLWQKMLNR